MPTPAELDTLAVNTIRTLSIDAVQQAKSGHPGTPMALAPLVYTLWNRVLRFDPADPIWPNRDRFVLSNGHASMLLWSVLHLSGTRAVNADYERLGQPSVTLDDIKRFRQLDSRAPGHPEYHWVSGVETTTGPLGQGVATSVGMAIAGRWLAARYNRPGQGRTEIAFTEDVTPRFLGYGWNVLRVGDANHVERRDGPERGELLHRWSREIARNLQPFGLRVRDRCEEDRPRGWRPRSATPGAVADHGVPAVPVCDAALVHLLIEHDRNCGHWYARRASR